MSLVGFYIAATVAVLVQFIRARDRRLIPLLALFAFLAMAHSQGDWYAARPFHLAAGVAGLTLLFMFTSRQRAGR